MVYFIGFFDTICLGGWGIFAARVRRDVICLARNVHVRLS